MILLKLTPLWMAARGLLAERGADFFSCWVKVATTFDREDIHDLRVASRRLREALALFAPCYPDGRITRLRKNVAGVTEILGDLRNIDEGIAFFREEAKELDGEQERELAGFIARFEKKREAARSRLTRDLRKISCDTLRKKFVGTVHSPYLLNPPSGKADPFMTIEDFARECIDQRLVPVLLLVPAARQPADAAAQHRMRIAVKKYRYRMEVLSPLTNDGYRELHGHVKEYQEILGRIHDLDVFAGLVANSRLTAPTKEKLTGLIVGEREKSFGLFLEKLDNTPFEQIGERVRSIM
ncbi:MAG TPA: CHAD domain-containing protein [Geobacteraceae bacterium]|nr:CHAD domain-containing protein [Geobacteraceae bacterium]